MSRLTNYHWRWFRVVFLCACMILALILPKNHVHAQGTDFIEIPLERFNDQKSIELSGLMDSQTLNFAVPLSWLVGEENWLEVRITTSPLLDSARSSLTISLNSLQVSSYRVAEITDQKQRILIPADMFTQGNNVLTFTAALYLPDDGETNCQNWDDPARWLTISPGGLLHLSFFRRDPPIDLSNFPQIFIEPLENFLPDHDNRQTLFVLPENSTQDDLTTLSILSYLLGGNADPTYNWHPEIVITNQLSETISANRNIIFIGQVPTDFQQALNDDKDFIAVFPSPWGAGNVIMIIGDQKRQDGFSPAFVFSDPARNALLHGNIAYLEHFTPSAPPPIPNNVSFEDLGYLDRTARGIGQHNIIYTLHIPYNIDPTLVKLNLDLLHSPDLDLQNSFFTVYLNGFSVASILPNARSSTGEPITIGLPAKKFRPGANFIRVQSDLHTSFHSCERAPESVWATILNSTTLELTYRNQSPIPSLKHFPMPFSEYPGVVYVIPDQYDQIDLGYLARLSFTMGTSTYTVIYPPEVMTAGNFLKMATQPRNVILLGLPSQNPATMSVNDLLPQPFTKDGKALQRGYGIYLPSSDTEASLGLVQIIPSPWTKDGIVLALTGNSQEGLAWAIEVLSDPAARDQFAGNLMVVGYANRTQSSGEATSQQIPQPVFQQIADASNIPFVGPILQRSGQAFLIPALSAVATGLLLVICISWLWGKIQNRNTADRTEKRDEREEDDR